MLDHSGLASATLQPEAVVEIWSVRKIDCHRLAPLLSGTGTIVAFKVYGSHTLIAFSRNSAEKRKPAGLRWTLRRKVPSAYADGR